MVDLSAQMTMALRKHMDSKSRKEAEARVAEDTDKKGIFLLRLAWTVEIIAVLIGLIISFTMPYVNYKEIENPTLFDTASFLQGMLPFLAIAVVEITKIPLALGFYRSKMLRWKTLFLTALLLVMAITFETMFNGLENNFSNLTSRIVREENKISDLSLEMENLKIDLEKKNTEIKTIQDMNLETILSGYLNKRESEDKSRAREIELIENQERAIREKYQAEKDIVSREINLKENQVINITQKIENPELIGLQDTIERLEKDKEKVTNKAKDIYDSEIKNLMQQLKLEQEETFSSDEEIEKIQSRINEKENEKKNYILTEENKIQTKIDIKEREKSNLEKKISASMNIKQNVNQSDIDKLNKKMSQIGEDEKKELAKFQIDRKRIQDKYTEKNKLTASFQKDAEEELAREKSKVKPLQNDVEDINNKMTEIKEQIREAKKEKREKIQNSNIYRIAALFGKKKIGPDGEPIPRDIANVTKEDTRIVALVWFGSIAFIVSVIGVILALASYVLRDPDNFLAKKDRYIFKSVRRLITSVSLMFRKIGSLFVILGKGITSFFDGITHILDRRIRDGIRRTLIGLRKRAREPKVKVVEVPKEVVVEKKVEVPVEVEKVVFKEVPKEVIRREMVHIPLYSTEHGKVDLSATKMSEVATENFTNAKTESSKTSSSFFKPKTKDNSSKKKTK